MWEWGARGGLGGVCVSELNQFSWQQDKMTESDKQSESDDFLSH